MSEIVPRKRPSTVEVLPNDDASPSGIVLTVAEANAIWYDSQDDEDRLGRYWEDPALGPLVRRISDWIRSGGGW